MKKRIVAFLIVIMFVPMIAFAQTRQDLAVGMANVFGLQANISGLYYYNDWLQIDKNARGLVGAASQSGLFQPPRGQYAPQTVVGNDDYNVATKGLDEFIFLSSNYEKIFGTVGSGGAIALDDGGTINVDSSTPYLSTRGLGTCAELVQGEKVDICRDKSGRVLIVWAQKSGGLDSDMSSYEVVAVRQGDLYLWDVYDSQFIFKSASILKFGMWASLASKYDMLNILSSAKIFSGGTEIWCGDINASWLDERANYVVGKNPKDGSLAILHVEFE